MPRLPRIWSDPNAAFDNNNWGQLLNEYLRVDHGADGTHSSMSAIATGSTTARTLADRFADIINVKDFGATGDGVTNDTAAIQAAIDAARAIAAGPAFGTLSRSGTVFFPPGSYSISHLDCTGAVGLELIGKAAWGVTLYADKQVTTGKAILDFTGSIGCRARGIMLSAFTPGGTDPAVRPTVGWLIAASSAGNDSTAGIFETCGTEGKFSAAALYIFGGTNHTFIDCGFSQALKTQKTVLIGANNVDAVTSAFTTIHPTTPNTGEITFVSPEIHGANDATATGEVTRLDSTFSIKVFGGVHDSSGDYHVRFNGTTNQVLFEGVEFYSESGTAANDLFYFDDATVNGLIVVNPDLDNSAFTTNLLNFGTSINATGLRLIGLKASRLLGSNVYFGAETFLAFGDPAVNLVGGGGTQYLGIGSFNATEANVEFVVPRSGVITHIMSRTGGSPGGAQTYTLTLRKNASATGLVITQTGADVTGEDTDPPVTVARGDRLAVEAVPSATAANTGSVWVTVGFIPA